MSKCDDVDDGVFSMVHGTTPAISGDLVTRSPIKVLKSRTELCRTLHEVVDYVALFS